ncbi:MAG TPA: carbohydrate ABC transporter permease [Spirochaetia bacterium]|nr:carbohydrate ABC transporter permease [Spirochaetia bacterium]
MSYPLTRSILSTQERRSPGARAVITVCYVLALVLTLVMFYPLAWVFFNALKDSKEIYDIPPGLFPTHPQWGNYPEAWRIYQLGPTMVNTLVVFAGVVVVKLVVLAMAAFALAHLRLPARRVVFLVFLSTLLLPTVAYLVPSFLAVANVPLLGFNLLNTYWALWIPAAADSFSLLMLKNFFDEIPGELLEAGRIDGASHARILARIILPLAKPILAVLGIFTFLSVWNDFFWTRLVLGNVPELWPVSVSLWYHSTVVGAQPPANVQLAAMALASVPPLVLFLNFQKHITQGVSFSGIKG